MILAEDEIILQIRKENQEAKELLFSLYENNFRNIEKKVKYLLRFIGIGLEDLRSIICQETLKIISKKRKQVERKLYQRLPLTDN